MAHAKAVSHLRSWRVVLTRTAVITDCDEMPRTLALTLTPTDAAAPMRCNSSSSVTQAIVQPLRALRRLAGVGSQDPTENTPFLIFSCVCPEPVLVQ